MNGMALKELAEESYCTEPNLSLTGKQQSRSSVPPGVCCSGTSKTRGDRLTGRYAALATGTGSFVQGHDVCFCATCVFPLIEDGGCIARIHGFLSVPECSRLFFSPDTTRVCLCV